MTNGATLIRSSRHEANVRAKAERALAAIVTLVEQRIVPSPAFYPATLAEGLAAMAHWLFDDETSTISLAMWTAISLQLELDGADGPVVFSSSRPYIRQAISARIESLSVADPFDFGGF